MLQNQMCKTKRDILKYIKVKYKKWQIYRISIVIVSSKNSIDPKVWFI